MKAPRRYPLAPLAAALTADALRRGDPPPGRDTLADILDVGDNTISRWAADGIPSVHRYRGAVRRHRTDDLALAIGRHPTSIWDAWDRGCDGTHPLDECTCEELEDDTPDDDPPMDVCGSVDPATLPRRTRVDMGQAARIMDAPWPSDPSPTPSEHASSSYSRAA